MTLVWLEGIVATIESYAKSKCYDPISWLHLHFAIWAIVVNPDDYHSKRTNAADTPVESPPHLSTSYIYNIYIYILFAIFLHSRCSTLSLSLTPSSSPFRLRNIANCGDYVFSFEICRKILLYIFDTCSTILQPKNCVGYKWWNRTLCLFGIFVLRLTTNHWI